MRCTLIVLALLLGTVSASDFPLTAWVSLTKGDRGLGSYFVQIRIERTMYISRDFCAEAGFVGGPYPAALNRGKTAVELRTGKKVCKYHVLDSRPFLTKGKKPE
ncbi:MAG: hypothetical protein JO266_03120 [Acidobacteria bacterium]|nr:hypothetical protein [Acidobacteriota bacterium]